MQPPQGTKLGLVLTRRKSIMTNNPNGFQRETKIKDKWLDAVQNFITLGQSCLNEGSKPEPDCPELWSDRDFLLLISASLKICSTSELWCKVWFVCHTSLHVCTRLELKQKE